MAKIITARKKRPLVSIVILNWNGLEDTLNCLDSVRSLKYKEYEVVIVDNGSSGSLKALEKRVSKNIQLVKNPVNMGFAGGEISALPYCHGDYILLLNNDALIHPDALDVCLKTFESDEKIAVVGSRSYSIDEDGQKTHNFYSFQRIDPVTADVLSYKVDPGSIIDAPTVSGSGVMIKKTAIDAYGYFDERFFAYYEETDLFARYLRAGLRVVYNPAFIIWHKDGASTRNKRFMYYYLMLKNQFIFAYKNFDKSLLKDFKKTYFRNFRRSLWVYLKDRSKTEAIHKARVRSTVWNLIYFLGTIRSRRKTFSISPNFSYSSVLFNEQPLAYSIVIDATNSNSEETLKSIKKILALKSVPSEIVIVSRIPIEKIPKSIFTTIQVVIDKQNFKLSPYDFGFMCTNTEFLLFRTVEEIHNADSEKMSSDLVRAYRSIVANDAAIVVDKAKTIFKSDLAFVNGKNVHLVLIRKNDLVNYLDIHKTINSLNTSVIGGFINWCVMDCKPVARITVSTKNLSLNIKTPESHYTVLNNSARWHVKKTLRVLHLSRIISKLRKTISRHQLTTSDELPSTAHSILPSTKAPIKNFPVIINTRDRFDPLVTLVKWLESAEQKKIAFVDNDSTNPELLHLFAHTPYQVIPLGRNGLHKAPWESFAVRFLTKGLPYILSDPDIIPTEQTPKDTIKHLYSLLQKFPDYDKVGVALKIDDIPEHYQMKQAVIDWESRFWDSSLLLKKDVFAADLDTTLAIYRGGTEWFLSPSIRVAGKYAMHHEPWYQDLNNPTDDMLYYRIRASNDVSTWTKGNLPKHHIRALKKEGLL
ncbi:MAG: glycosyltransferase family 2 protein [Candidatus Saccharimonadales bacterium]